MKTQIIQLEPHDDVISTRDKMGWAQTSRILLVWPGKSKILFRKLDLVLLLRHSYALGAQLALVAHDEEVRYYASQLRVPVFTSIRQAQTERWRSARWRRSQSFRRKPRPDFNDLKEQIHPGFAKWTDSRILRLIALTLSLAAFLLVLLLILPGAQVVIDPEVREQVIEVPFKASLNASSVDLTTEISARLQTIQVEGRSTITATGVTYVPYKPAEGTVKFTNLTDQEVQIPAGTVVSTLGSEIVRFKTVRDSKVWAGPGQIMLVPVKAIAWGTTGNQPFDTIRAIEGPLGLMLSVTNPSATKNGSDAPAPAPTKEDQAHLYNQLLAELSKSASSELMHAYTDQPNTTDFPITATLRLSNIMEESYTPEVGQPGDQLQLSLRLEFEAMVVPTVELRKSLNQLMDSKLQGNDIPDPNSLVIEHMGSPQLDEQDDAHWIVRGIREIRAQINPNHVADLLRGRRSDSVSAYLSGLPLQGSTKVQMFPAWWPYFPFLPFRIEVEELEKLSIKAVP